LGAIKVQKLKPRDLNTFYASKLGGGRLDGKKGGLSVSTVIKLHALIHHALKDAVKWEIVARNVADAASPPSASALGAPDISIWSADQLGRFLDHVETTNDVYAPAFRVAAMTGLRRGELLGLAWSDVDLDGAAVTIRAQLIAINREVSLVETTKTRRKRRVDLDPATVAVLRAQRQHQREQRLQVGASYKDTGLVFTRADGSWIDPHLFSMAFVRRVKAAGLPPIRFHDLRHTHISMLVSAGKIKVASARAGHSSVSFTLQQYAHLAPTEQAEAAAEIAGLVDRTRKRRTS
jgi:integrase